MSGEALMPCPFCGSEDLDGPHCTEYIGDTHKPSWWVECTNCPASMTLWGDPTSESLRKAWNTRASEKGKTL